MKSFSAQYSNLLKQMLHYASYYLAIWVVHLLVISFIAFFHFLLKHPLDIIEDWVFANGWEIISITKFIAGFIALRFITLKIDSRQPIRDFFVNGFVWPRSEVFIIIIFLATFFVFSAKPEQVERNRIEFIRMIFSYMGIFIFYMIDIFVIDSLERSYPIPTKQRWIPMLIFPSVVLLLSKQVFWYGEEIDFLVFFNFLLCLILWRWGKRNWSLPFAYICLFAAPLGVLIGIDPIWGSAFSPLKVSTSLGLEHYIVILAVVLGYLFYKKRWTAEVHQERNIL